MPTLTQLLDILELDPEDPVTHFSLAGAYRTAGEKEKALEHYRLATRFKPDYSAAWFEMARMAEEQGDVPVAMEAYAGAMTASSRAGDDHILNAARVRMRRLERRQGGSKQA